MPTFRDDVIAVARTALGPGFEAASLVDLKAEVFRRWIRPRIESVLLQRIDLSAEESARAAAEDALKAETQARKDAEASVRQTVNAALGDI